MQEQRKLDLNELEYALLMVLKKHIKTNTNELIKGVRKLLKETEALRFTR
ncbi:hypothetical protein [Thermococcus piezophilus]|nr:hypothetical protein [Thermococcus piezophilus]